CQDIVLFFFFQAEDGIRDKLVTGVQTCALPISGRGRLRVTSVTRHVVRMFPCPWPRPDSCPPRGRQSRARTVVRNDALIKLHTRSEERRVGKECRYQWWR